jgi:acetyltransferase-like isoleucine patch superfamily enzyme
MSSLPVRAAARLRRLWFALRYRGSFAKLGRGAFLQSPFRIDGAAGIRLGEGSVMQRGGWLYCLARDGRPARIEIGCGCVFGFNNHITAIESVRIGDLVLTANNVYISDNLHGYEDISKPIMQQPLRVKGPVEIGSGSWLGENAAVIGVRIGRNCVIGANAVVTHDIPDYCVAVGIPARVIRHYDPLRQAWIAGPPAELQDTSK